MSRKRNFVFTLNNYGTSDEERVQGLTGVKYVCYGRETAPTTGTRHLQGYVVFDNARTIPSVRNLLAGCHVETARGTPQQCKDYCTKDGDYFERGELPASRADAGIRERERWATALEKAKAGEIEDIPADIQLRYYSTLKRIRTDYQPAPKSLEGTCGLWIYGGAGTGKTRAVFETYENAYPKGVNKWWCGYQGEEIVLLDDIDPSHKSWIGYYLKKWADRYPFIGESKGGSRKIRPKKLIVTSQYTIEQIFEDKETREALLRRFVVVEKEKDQNIII